MGMAEFAVVRVRKLHKISSRRNWQIELGTGEVVIILRTTVGYAVRGCATAVSEELVISALVMSSLFTNSLTGKYYYWVCTP